MRTQTRSFYHKIVGYNIKEDYNEAGTKIKLGRLLRDRFYKSGAFNQYAKKWFENEVKHMYPNAVKCSDSTLCGFHFETEELVIELQ